MNAIFRIILIGLVFFANPLYSVDESKIPSSLLEWKDWALDDVKDADCPVQYSSGKRECTWYSALDVSLEPKILKYTMNVVLHKDKSVVQLPNGYETWPSSVKVDGVESTVLDGENSPIVLLGKGRHRVEGSIAWGNSMKYLQIPKGTALVTLHKNNTKMPVVVDDSSKLWISKTTPRNGKKGALSVSLYRMVMDGHPMKMLTYLHISASGKMRSVELDGIVLDGFLPTNLTSNKLDASITDNNKLKVEVKAGEWIIIVESYAPQNIHQLKIPKHKFAYANQEIWSLKRDPLYRTIEISGVEAVDPTQTNLPKEWRKYPAYMIDEKIFKIKELYKSVKQEQTNNFDLHREMWLDFNGAGYTVHDRVDAKISEIRRFEVGDILKLASVSINGKPALITTTGESLAHGIELREPKSKIYASSRIVEDLSKPPVSGWKQKFDSIYTTLHLPPGWQLLASFGSDGKGKAWVDRWSLMDIFLVLLIGIAIFQLYGVRWALPAVLFLILIWHEYDAPTVVWLLVLVFVALLRVVKDGKLHKVIKTLGVVTMAVALWQVFSFSVYEIRTAIYPQLEKGHYEDFMAIPSAVEQTKKVEIRKSKKVASADIKLNKPEVVDYNHYGSSRDLGTITTYGGWSKSMNGWRQEPSKAGIGYGRNTLPSSSFVQDKKLMQNRIDPNAVVQTGVARPSWNWNEFRFSWQSATAMDDRLELWLVPPVVGKLLKIINIFGVIFMLYMFLRDYISVDYSKIRLRQGGMMSLLFILALTPNLAKADFPSKQMLDELESKFTEPAACLPNCASVNSVSAKIRQDKLDIELDISAGCDVSVPILGSRKSWLPNSVRVDGNNTSLRLESDGSLWISLRKGIRKIKMSGSIAGQDQIVLSSQLPLHNVATNSYSNQWKISSDNKSYIEVNSLREKDAKTKQTNQLEPYVHVVRTIYFGQRWYVETVVSMLNRTDTVHTFAYPLLPNESVLNKEIEIEGGKAILHLGGDSRTYAWRSSIPIASELVLGYPKKSKYIQEWKMDVSAIWHMQSSGLDPVAYSKSGGILMPIFKPWQGDKLKLELSKTKAVSGRSLSIEHSNLEIVQSGRYRDVSLDLRLKSSRAEQYVVDIGNIDKLKSANIDGANNFLKVESGKVTIPLKAKSQRIKLTWREKSKESTSYSFPIVNLGTQSANSNVSLRLPDQRWILWTSGSMMGPAVLLWGVMLSLVVFGIILGRVRDIPLRSSDWVLLGLGICTTSLIAMVPVVLWIFAFRYKSQSLEKDGTTWSNVYQVLLVLITVVALVAIVGSVFTGLLGNPDMMITGNSSYGHHLHWYSDRIDDTLAQPTVISVSIWYYRVLMLIWAIWISFALIKWLKWAWKIFAQGGIWRESEKKRRASKPTK